MFLQSEVSLRLEGGRACMPALCARRASEELLPLLLWGQCRVDLVPGAGGD